MEKRFASLACNSPSLSTSGHESLLVSRKEILFCLCVSVLKDLGFRDVMELKPEEPDLVHEEWRWASWTRESISHDLVHLLNQESRLGFYLTVHSKEHPTFFNSKCIIHPSFPRGITRGWMASVLEHWIPLMFPSRTVKKDHWRFDGPTAIINEQNP